MKALNVGDFNKCYCVKKKKSPNTSNTQDQIIL